MGGHTTEGRVSLWERVEPLLLDVERPSRYIGSEFGARDPGDASFRVALAYPDTYEVGQPNQGLAILYDIVNRMPDASAERVFLPWKDMAEALRRESIPLFVLESMSPVKDVDLLGITVPHELAATNILELLDLSGIPLRAEDRGEKDTLVIGGGPSIYNPEPFAPFFDAVVIGDGEEVITRIVEVLTEARNEGRTRVEKLETLATLTGVYVPSFYGTTETAGVSVVQSIHPGAPMPVERAILEDLESVPALTEPVVPYMDVVHDRLSVEIMRGCARGCRFCQAGMTYRPIRERSADTIVTAATEGLRRTGYDEVSLMSLSSTDHSCIAPVLSRLNTVLEDSGKNISLPSQRLDSFGVEMAQLVAGGKKGGLTFAPEAGSQRLRDVINKNVTEQDLVDAARAAFANGWMRLKLYFMIGLPTETDEDVLAIAELVKRVLEVARDEIPGDRRGGLMVSVSVAVFVPKSVTPFQWFGQIPHDEVLRRVRLLQGAMPKRNVQFRYHDTGTSRLEAAISKADRRGADLIEMAWREGARFDAWSDEFDFDRWSRAATSIGVDLDEWAQRSFDVDGPLPWDHIDAGVSRAFLAREWKRALEALTTPDCTFVGCTGCRLCQDRVVENVLAGERHGAR